MFEIPARSAWALPSASIFRFGIHREHVLEQMRDAKRDNTGTASEVEQPTAPVETEGIAQKRDQRFRIARTKAPVVPRTCLGFEGGVRY